jgi:hypothetical protein
VVLSRWHGKPPDRGHKPLDRSRQGNTRLGRPNVQTVDSNVTGFRRIKTFYINASNIVTLKEVTTARFPEDAFNKGLVAVNYESEESKETDHTKCDPPMTKDVISEDPPSTLTSVA